MQRTKKRLTKIVKTKLLFGLISATLCNTALASDATPEDNVDLRERMNFLTGALDTFIVAGLVPFDPVSRPGEIGEFATNLSLKAIAPVLDIPADKYLLPNTGDGCSRNFTLPQSTDQYDNWFGFWELTAIASDWGDLGTPNVYHANTSVLLTVGLSGDTDPLATEVSLPAGKHNAYWKAETLLSPFWDVTLPILLMLPNASAEGKYGEGVAKKTAKASAKKASKIKKALAQVAKRVAKTAGLKTASFLASGIFDDSTSTVSNAASQSIVVYDVHTPIISTSDTQITVEARNFGGSFFSRVEPDLLETITYYDQCNRPVTLRADAPSFLPIGKSTVTWTVSDGDYYSSGVEPTASITQVVDVQDTQAPLLVPPAGFALYSDQAIDPSEDELFLGSPLVVDLADPTPSVARDIPDLMEPGFRYFINYTATDDSTNSTQAPQDEPEKYSQIVTIKLPGTNTTPNAVAQQAESTTSVPVSITLEGVDIDELPIANSPDSRVDPLDFLIVDRPKNGEFVAPLLPYFIEDFRAQPEEAITGEVDYRTLSCPADLTDSKALEAKLGLLEKFVRDDYVTKCYCDRAGAPVPKGFIYSPDYIHITDENEYFVSDSAWACNNDPKGTTKKRTAKFKDGELLASSSSLGVFQLDADNILWRTSFNGQGGSRTATIIGVDSNLRAISQKPAGAKFTFDSLRDSGESFKVDAANLQSTHVDAKHKVVYVNDQSRIYMFDYDDPQKYLGTVKQGEPFVRECPGNGGFWMETDSQGNLYQLCMSKIHKIAPPQIINGKKVPGDYIGWIGKCDGNKVDPETQVPYNYCDEETQTSRGFQCTNETCESASFFADRFGSNPGQFSRARHINIDPNDILYVVDYDNSRIQRFSPDGTFAGEAVSTGEGVTKDGSFVLGNMGKPSNVSVNSTEFHVLESNTSNADFFLHIFKTLPFYDVTDSSAKVDYVSNQNFQGTDTFSYLVDDGIDSSATAEVSLSIERAFRAPQNLLAVCYTDDAFTNTQACSVNEDEELYIRISADDQDGFVGFGGLDRLTFDVEEAAENGELKLLDKQVSFQNLVYRPSRNFFGTDKFSFQANDGDKSAQQASVVNINVMPVSDPVKVTFAENIDVARGFDESFNFEFEDVDQGSFPQPEIVSINWGDGVIASEQNDWQGVGVEDENGDPVYPQYNTTPGNGMIVAAHSFDTSVAGIEVCMRDGEEGIVCQSSLSVSAQNSTNVSISRMDDVSIEPNQDFVFKLQLINQKPDSWDGLTANDIEFSFALAQGLSAVSMDSRCSGTVEISCSIDKLDIQQQTIVELALQTTPSVAQERQIFAMDIAATDAGPRLKDTTYTITSISAADDDSDDTINYYDEFPQDVRYVTDSDKDGIADRYEQQYGLDPSLASDAQIDADGDGANALTEFLNDTSPYLADAFYVANKLKLPEIETTPFDDAFGSTVASGDINGDGFDDVIAGAPGYGGNGAVFVFYGNVQGVGQANQLIPESLMDNASFGNRVAAGDLNDDGFDDIAVISNQAIYLFWGSDSGEELAQSQIKPPSVDGRIAQAIAIEDADGDGKADLIMTSKFFESDYGPTGAIHVYLGVDQFWQLLDPEPKMSISNTEYFYMGDSLAIGDLDGDALPDFVIGSPYESGLVLGYYGKNIDWQSGRHEFTNFEILDNSANRFAVALSAGMDWDGDAKADIFVGTFFSDSVGDVRIYQSGNNFRNTDIIRINDEQQNTQFGVALDPLQASRFMTEKSVLVGNYRQTNDEQINTGSITIFTGNELQTVALKFYGQEHEMLGYAIDASADINNDGVLDIIAGAPEFTTNEHLFNTGQIYIYLGGQSAKQTDEDADLAGDEIDNCLNLANTDQINTDGDNFGNACDADDDNDGVLDAVDAFPLDASESADTDLDGIGNNADNDDDNDELPDTYELANGLDPLDALDGAQDKDMDGLSNVEEYLLGTDVSLADSDGDGIEDSVDTNPLVFDQVDEQLYSGQITILPDMNSDGVQEIGVLQVVAEDTTVVLQILNGVGQQELSQLVWSDGYEDRTLSLHVIDDLNGNGAPEVGLFGVRDSANNEGKAQMFIRDLSSGARVSVLNWPANWREVSARILPDMTGDGLAEVGLQGRFKEGYRPQLVIRNGLTNANVGTFGYPNMFDQPQFYAHSDVNADGVSEIATFGRISRNNKIQIKIANGINSQDRLKAYNFPDKWADISWHRLDDSNGDGIDDWGLFGTNKQDGRPQLIVKDGTDPQGAISIYAWPAQIQAAQFFAIPDMNNDGVDEVAVAGQRSNNGRYQFQVQDGTNRNVVLSNHNLNLNLQDIRYHVLPDLSGDGQVEIGFMGINSNGEWELIIRHGDISQSEYSVGNLGSDWQSAPAVTSLGDTDNDGLMNLLIYGQDSSGERLRIENH